MHKVEDVLRGLDDVHLAAVGGRRAVGVEVCRRREGLVEERILAIPGAGVEINYYFVVVDRKGQTARGCGGGGGIVRERGAVVITVVSNIISGVRTISKSDCKEDGLI